MPSLLSLSPLPLSMQCSVPVVRYRSNTVPAQPSPPRRPGFVRAYGSTDLRRYALNRRWLDKALRVDWQARAQTDDESPSAAPNVARLSEAYSQYVSISTPLSTKPPRPSLKRTESMTLSPTSLATAAKRPTRPIMRCTVTVTLAPPSSSSFPAPTASRRSIARTASILDLPTLLSPSCTYRQLHRMYSLVLICLLLLLRRKSTPGRALRLPRSC
ncbi:hypothetical protein K438DRAFT_1858964 [Mycena galopus ATCC 62051]|nr:hypothetical protein K438DRAFT_1858964 [Mycena galopus ATCC 62051]